MKLTADEIARRMVYLDSVLENVRVGYLNSIENDLPADWEKLNIIAYLEPSETPSIDDIPYTGEHWLKIMWTNLEEAKKFETVKDRVTRIDETCCKAGFLEKQKEHAEAEKWLRSNK